MRTGVRERKREKKETERQKRLEREGEKKRAGEKISDEIRRTQRLEIQNKIR